MSLSETVSDDIADRADYGFINETHPNMVFFHTYYRLVCIHNNLLFTHVPYNNIYNRVNII